MALDVEKLIADTKAARAAADAQKAKVDKAAAALEASKKANKSTTAKVANEINYVNSLSASLADIEGKLTTYAISIGRGDKLGPGEQKEFDTLVKQYKDADKAYKSTIAKIDKTLASAPSPTKVEVKKGKVSIAPTAEEMAVTDIQGKPQTGVTAASVEQINKQLDALNQNPRGFIFAMQPSERINLAKTLTAAGYQTPDLNGEFNDGLVANYKAAISQAKSWNTNNKNLEGYVPVDLSGFLSYRTRLSKAAGAGAGAGAGAPTQWGTISNATQAKAAINDVVTSLLGREATDKEVANITKKLTAAQKANPYKQVNGMTVGGLDVGQFITDIVKTLPEYTAKIQAKQDIVAQGIEATAKANGLKLRPEEIKSYADRVKKGEDIKTIENLIRSTASLGQPDAIKKLILEGTDLETIYSPYKRIMANSLGINANTITLDDPTLRMAIGPDKEMSLYDYQKAIRTDNRWKYSQEANDEVTNMINQVKRDFGFMG
jgi:hypothetical protein